MVVRGHFESESFCGPEGCFEHSASETTPPSLVWPTQALLDGLDCGKRFIDFKWKQWGSAEEGGVTKPSTVVF